MNYLCLWLFLLRSRMRIYSIMLLAGLLLFVCDGCGGRKVVKPKKKKVRRVEYRHKKDTTVIDSLLCDSIDSLTTDSILTNLDTLSIPSTLDSLAKIDLQNYLFISSNFVEVRSLIPDLIEEIRYNSDYNFVGRKIDGYMENVALLTHVACDSLVKVADELRAQGYRLKIYDAYRPQRAVEHFRSWVMNGDIKMKADFYPDKSKSVLFKEGYISSHSKHCRGSTIDMTLCDNDGNDLDMGGSFDLFSETSHSDYVETLSDAQITNRSLLRDAMERHGFVIATTEWWHFSLKDEPFVDRSFDFPVASMQTLDAMELLAISRDGKLP